MLKVVGRAIPFMLPGLIAPVHAWAVNLDDYWNGAAHFTKVSELDMYNTPPTGIDPSTNFATYDFENTGGSYPNPPAIPSPNASYRTYLANMNTATTLVQGMPTDDRYYLFSREFDFAPYPYSEDGAAGTCAQSMSRIVVRTGSTAEGPWSMPVAVAGPPLNADWSNQDWSDPAACGVLDGHVFLDPSGPTGPRWHILAQCQAQATEPELFSICHYYLDGDSPVGPFTRSPVIVHSSDSNMFSWPTTYDSTGSLQIGTPEIIRKESDGRFAISAHFAKGGLSYRISGHVDSSFTNYTWNPIPAFGPGDCLNWDVPWHAGACVGGGNASTIWSGTHWYMLVESADDSIACSDGQHWAMGLVRSDGLPFQTGNIESFPLNPIIAPERTRRCEVQYQRLFTDHNGDTYLTYWDTSPGTTSLSGTPDAPWPNVPQFGKFITLRLDPGGNLSPANYFGDAIPQSPFTINRNFMTFLYNNLLGRPPEAWELLVWAGGLNARSFTLTAAAQAFLTLPDVRGPNARIFPAYDDPGFIDILYRAFLGVSSVPAGQQAWGPYLQANGRYNTLYWFLRSGEVANKLGNRFGGFVYYDISQQFLLEHGVGAVSDHDFVLFLDQTYLGRQPVGDEIATQTQNLLSWGDSDASRTTLARAFMDSEEFRRRITDPASWLNGGIYGGSYFGLLH